MDLQDKTVLVTGASSGIGKAIAIAFARKRANVLVHYGRNQKGAQDTLKEVEKYSGGRICQADLMEGEQISALFDDIRRTTPSIDVLVNNAGDARAGDIDDEASWDYEYRNILLSAVRVSHGFLAMPSSRLSQDHQHHFDLWKSPQWRAGISAILRVQRSACQCHDHAEPSDCSECHRQCGGSGLYRHA